MNAFASMQPGRRRAGLRLRLPGHRRSTRGPRSGPPRWHHTESERITVRAAFNAHTRGGWRAARRDEGGVIALGAPATFAVWDVPGELLVQTPDTRVAAWSTDPRAGVPHLPDLHPDVDLPTCRADRGARTGRLRRTRSTDMTPPRGKLDLDPVDGAQGAHARPPGRPADREPGQEAHHRVGGAGDAAAGRSPGRRRRRHPVGEPAGRRGPAATSGSSTASPLPVWDALVRGEADDLTPLAQKASAGSVRFRLPEGRDLTRAQAAAREAGRRRGQAHRRAAPGAGPAGEAATATRSSGRGST